MSRPDLWRRLLSELLSTALLVAVVIGSGIAAQRLSPGQIGLQLLENRCRPQPRCAAAPGSGSARSLPPPG